MKLLIAIPSVRPVEMQFVTSIIPCLMTFSTKEKNVEYSLYSPQAYCIGESRNSVVRMAIDGNYDYIFWVDSDIMLPMYALSKLMESGEDIISGVYAYKLVPVDRVVAKRYNENSDGYHDLTVKDLYNGVVEVDGIGFGCVLTKTDVFRHINYPYFKYRDDCGEDIFFCKKAQEVGYKIHLDTDVICEHIGIVKFDIPEKEEK